MTNTQFLEQKINNDLLIKMGFTWSRHSALEIYKIRNFYVAHIDKSYTHTNGNLIANLGFFSFKNAELEQLHEILINTKLDLNMFYDRYSHVWSLGKLGDLLLENKFSKAEIEKMFEKLY